MIVYGQDGVPNPYALQDAPAAPAGGTVTTETLYEMGIRLLGLVKQNFLSAGIPLPVREVVYPSPIPADCEQVAVLFSGWNPYPGGDGPMMCESFRWMADFSVIVTRCTPAMVAKTATKSLTPTAAKMHEAALMASKDSEIFINVLHDLGEFASPQISTQSPVGGLQTTELSVQIPAGGI